MNYFRYAGNQELVCPHIVLPETLARCKVAFDDWVVHSNPRAPRTTEWHPVFSECRVELLFNGRKIAITCDAVVATILSLFETPETLVLHSEIEARTGVKGLLLSAAIEQLCTRRPQDGLATGLLQVLQNFDCVEFCSTHAPCF